MGFKSKDKRQSAKTKIQNAVSMFTEARNQVDEANAILDEHKRQIVAQREAMLESIKGLDSEIESVNGEYQSNLTLKEKLSAFVTE